jgi:hypothetical protein
MMKLQQRLPEENLSKFMTALSAYKSSQITETELKTLLPELLLNDVSLIAEVNRLLPTSAKMRVPRSIRQYCEATGFLQTLREKTADSGHVYDEFIVVME